VPKFELDANGLRQPVYKTDAEGQQQPVLITKNKFLNRQNLAQLAKDTSFIAIMAVGATCVIIAGGIDLSVGAIYALASVLGALVLHKAGPEGLDKSSFVTAAMPGLCCCLGAGLACGLANGAMITLLRVHPFIITLGTMAIYRGIAFVITEGQSVGGFSASFTNLIRFETGEGLFLVPLAVMALVGLAGWLILSRLTLGRRIYAIGGNELASQFSGIAVNKTKLVIYTLAGGCAAVAAVLSLGYYGAATSGDGQGYELNVIAASVVGGASLSGGKGSALGAILGALVIQMISSGIIILKIDQNYSQIIIGMVVVLAVVFDQVKSYLDRKGALRSRIEPGSPN
jgi:ribose transport system permease protein